MLVCDVSVGCTCTVLLHILSGSVWVCNLWSARLWECNAHDWLKGCVVGQNRFHLHVSPIMSHAHSSSSSFLHVSVLSSSSSSLSLSSLSSTSTSHSTCCRSVEPCEDPQNEKCGLVADTTSSTDAGFTTVKTGTRGKWRTSTSLSLWRETWCGVCAEARSKCTTNTSLSLWTWKLDDKFFSRSRSFRETWCSVFMPQWIESKHILRKRPK